MDILYQCTRDELNSIAEHYDVSLRASLKSGMQKELRDALTERGVLAEEEDGGRERRLTTAGVEVSCREMMLWNWRI